MNNLKRERAWGKLHFKAGYYSKLFGISGKIFTNVKLE